MNAAQALTAARAAGIQVGSDGNLSGAAAGLVLSPRLWRYDPFGAFVRQALLRAPVSPRR
jgi:hypothetical protein